VWQPLVDLRAIRHHHALVALFLGDPELHDELHVALKDVPDLDRLGMQTKLPGLVDTRTFAAVTLPGLLAKLEGAAAVGEGEGGCAAALLRNASGDALRGAGGDSGAFVDMVGAVVDMTHNSDSGEMRINPAHSPQLVELSEQVGEAKDTTDQFFYDCSSGGGDARVPWSAKEGAGPKLEPDKQHGWITRFHDAKMEKNLRGKPSWNVLKALENGIHVTHATLRDASAGYAAAAADSEREQGALVKQAVDVASSYMPVVEAAVEAVGTLGVLLGFAHAAAFAPAPYCRPGVVAPGDEGGSTPLSKQPRLLFTAARHPCVELQDATTSTPNDYAMQRGASRFQIITGPNMGGKSTYIRTLGTICVMAQMGSFVPAGAATLSVLDSVLARVGAGDSAQRESRRSWRRCSRPRSSCRPPRSAAPCSWTSRYRSAGRRRSAGEERA